ncbi:hypothetical protein SpCBS45565_g04886 [Spizellomyces sp. 'palustris']|nr:hypothetical protein SpCBS45565_g04886 [Spizellomyces sp. 'palustris']
MSSSVSHTLRLLQRNCHHQPPWYFQKRYKTADALKAGYATPHPKIRSDKNAALWPRPNSDQQRQSPPLHSVYSEKELRVEETHEPRKEWADAVAFAAVRTLRFGFDTATGYSDRLNRMSEWQWLNRIVFLETIAGVPGMVAGMTRHMLSMRTLKKDEGWINTMLEEAENERMHLMTFLTLKQPTPLLRFFVLSGQAVFFALYFLAYMVSPRTCHRFVGYLEEEAVHTYTNCLKDIKVGEIRHWSHTPAPLIAKSYWRLKEGATVEDVVAAVRADEAEHRTVNHTLAKLKPDDPSPFKVPHTK